MRGRLVSRRALLASILGAGSAGTLLAQQGVPVEPRPGDRLALPPREPLSGDDVGFRVDRVGRDGTRVGALMVRVDGKWVEAEIGHGLRRGTTSW